MALIAAAGASTPWTTLLNWAQAHPEKPAYKCVTEVESLAAWTNGTDLVSLAWQVFSSQNVPLQTDNQKFAEFKRKLLDYLETAPSGNSFSIEQLQGIQRQIDENETLVEMWNQTKQYYFNLARKNQVHRDFPDYAFGFSYFGKLAERVKAIKAQIHDLNHPRSLPFERVIHWYLCNTLLTHAFIPQPIASEFTHIQFIDLTYNRFETLGDFSGLDRLKILLLSHNCFQKIVVAHLPVSLERLDLDNNQLTKQPNLAALTHLVSLDLSGNQLAALSSRSLPPNLQILDVQRNPISSTNSVQSALPDLEVHSDQGTHPPRGKRTRDD